MCAALAPTQSEVTWEGDIMQNAPEASTWTGAGDVAYGDRLHHTLIAELSKAGCFAPTPARNVVYGAFILVGYAAAYVALLAAPALAPDLDPDVAAALHAEARQPALPAPPSAHHPRRSGRRATALRPVARASDADARPRRGAPELHADEPAGGSLSRRDLPRQPH